MRFLRVALLVLAAVAPDLAAGRAWKGINPGASTEQEVTGHFGAPTTKTKRGARSVLAYYGEQAPDGTRQAQFHLDASGVVVEITIFLTAQLDADSIEGTYGKPPQRTFVEDTFQKVWVYPAAGVTVYFSKDGNVEAMTFGTGTKAAVTRPAAAREGTPQAGAQR